MPFVDADLPAVKTRHDKYTYRDSNLVRAALLDLDERVMELEEGGGGGGGGAAADITVTPSGNLSSTDAQAALLELQGDIDSLTAASHAALTIGTANGLSLVAQALSLAAASAASAGAVTTGTQEFGGDKTFAGAMTISSSAGLDLTGVAADSNAVTVPSGARYKGSTHANGWVSFNAGAGTATFGSHVVSGGHVLLGASGEFGASSSNTPPVMASSWADAESATAEGPRIAAYGPSRVPLTHASAKLASFWNGLPAGGGAEEAYFGRDGNLVITGVASGANAVVVPAGSRLALDGAGTRYLADNGTNLVLNGAANVNGALQVLGNITQTNVNPILVAAGASHRVQGNPVDGASAVGVVLESGTNLANATAKLVSIRNNTSTERAYFGVDGSLVILGVTTGQNAVNLGTGSQRLKGGSNANGYLQFDPVGTAVFGTHIQAGPGGSVVSGANGAFASTVGSPAQFIGNQADSANSDAVQIGSDTLLTHATAKMVSIRNVRTVRGYFDRDAYWTGGVSPFGGLAVAQLATPVNTTHTTSTTGGTIPAGTKFYRVAARDAFGGSTPASTGTGVTSTGATSRNTPRWIPVPGAKSYDIFGGDEGLEEFLINVTTPSPSGISNILTWVDDGSITASGAPPEENTTGGYQATGTTSITAFASGGQASATQLGGELNFVTTVATGGDSVKLPTASLGRRMVVFNAGASSLDIFPASGAAIDALGADTAYSLAAGASREFWGQSSTAWHSR